MLVAALLFTAPFARVPLEKTEAFIPVYATAVLIIDLVTAALLLSLFSLQRSWAVLALSIGYIFSGVMVLPWAFTFPNVAALFGWPDAGLQTTAVIATFRRVSFPLCVLAYALMKERGPAWCIPRGAVRGVILGSIAAVLLVACGISWLVIASDDVLPLFMRDETRVSPLWQYVPATAVSLYMVGLAVLWSRRLSVLDLCLMVVLFTLLIEITLLSYLSAGLRLSVGWWAGRFYGLISASVVLLVLLSETMTLYARLTRSVLAERRARDARITAIEALSASITHEVNQPLASMVTNADAGIRWLARPEPDLAEANAALQRIVNDGHRTSNVIAGIRTMFKKGTQKRVAADLNRLLADTVQRSQAEAQLSGVALEAELFEKLPSVFANPIQLEQAISNLVTNSIDAMSTVKDRKRLLRVKSAIYEYGTIVVSVEDSGVGMDRASKERVFEPFYTTKPDGMGMGLIFCRWVIEAHGGRLWVTDNEPHGAIFQFILPSIDADFSLVKETAK
ncbi:ATP-binding protein [Roseibium sp. M-1]